jgi:hypothetical protein
MRCRRAPTPAVSGTLARRGGEQICLSVAKQTKVTMTLAKKLNLKPVMKLRVFAKPRDVDLDDLHTTRDGLAWIAYPKAGQLGTDLNRDILWKHLLASGVQGVRQIALDETWSALRFRPGKD